MPEVLNLGNPVLHKEQLLHLCLRVEPFDVLDVVETEVEGGKVLEVFQAVDVGNRVIVEVEFFEGVGERGESFDVEDAVLAEAEFAQREAGKIEGGDGGDAEVD